MSEQILSPDSHLSRALLVLTGLVLLITGVGFFEQMPWAISLWPWQDGKLSFMFIAAIMAAIGLPLFWLGWSGELAAMRGGALDLATTYTGLGMTILVGAESAKQWLSIPIVLGGIVLAALFNLWLYKWSSRLTFKDNRRTPNLVRWAFLLFGIILVVVGIALLLRYPYIYPWPLQPQSSVVFGWIYLGAAVYVLHSVIYPVWGNIKGQLLGFAAYDLVLLIPFINHIDVVKPAHQLSLSFYLLFIVCSLLLSLYYLLIARHWRL
jgi:heme/copper-type cytochrome/quinol oxidase subunit 4